MSDSERVQGLHDLIDLFETNIRQYKGRAYDEAKARSDFIDKFFRLLGWDVYNEKGYSEMYRDVVREDRIEIKGKVKAPDYCFRIGGARKFFVEAKKPAVDIKHDIEPAFQLRRYAFTARLPLSILTDFEEFAVYDTRIKPDKKDSAATARIFYCTYREYEREFAFIRDTFSREAILKGSFDRYIEETKRKKGTTEVDREFLKLIEQWREELAKNLALRNPSLTIHELNYAVQKVIDRIIFLRIAEDRHIEPYGRLQRLIEQKTHLYAELVKLFLQADVKYNSGLFDFKADRLTADLTIDDRVLKEIIRSVYYPDSPYEFSVFDVEILGNIYEQFLGKTIRLTAGHRAKVEEKPEVKKAGGVYYTPKYIVDYIVKHTVGETVAHKTPEQFAKIKICDPACGSGSFLIGAYQYLMDQHLGFYTEEKNLKKALKDQRIYPLRENEYRLTIDEKHRILLNNIHGVDIDPQAVEVTKLSLLLKLLEGESQESTGMLFKYTDIKLLPDLSGNIKCGNSLIGSDFYDTGQMSLFEDEDTARRINVFDWDKEFPGIFAEGGFDVIIGNPPYVRQEMLKESKAYFSTHFAVYHGVADLYAYFIEKGIKLLKPSGYFAFIVSNKWMRAGYGDPLRRFLKRKQILEIIDFGDLPVFQTATTYPCILRVRNRDLDLSLAEGKNDIQEFKAIRLESLKFSDLAAHVQDNAFNIRVAHLHDSGWSLTHPRAQALLNKLRGMIDSGEAVTLKDYVQGKIFYGIKTGLNKAFVLDEETRNRLITDDPKSEEIIKPFLLGRDIKRYYARPSKHLILIPKGWTNSNISKGKNPWDFFRGTYPAIANHLAPFAAEAEKRYDKGDYWWELRACDYYKEFEKPKIIVPDISLRGNFTIDRDGKIFSVNTTYIIGSSDKFLLGILNSKLITFFYKHLSSSYRGNYLRFIFQYLSLIPVCKYEDSTKGNQQKRDLMISLITTIMDLKEETQKQKVDTERVAMEKKIQAIDSKIDTMVYELYDLNEQDIHIIEKSDK